MSHEELKQQPLDIDQILPDMAYSFMNLRDAMKLMLSGSNTQEARFEEIFHRLRESEETNQELKEQIVTYEITLKQHEDDIKILKEKGGEGEQLIGRIMAVENKIDDNIIKIERNNNTIADHNEKIENNKERVSRMNDKMNLQDGRIKILEEGLAQLQEGFNTLKTIVGDIKGMEMPELPTVQPVIVQNNEELENMAKGMEQTLSNLISRQEFIEYTQNMNIQHNNTISRIDGINKDIDNINELLKKTKEIADKGESMAREALIISKDTCNRIIDCEEKLEENGHILEMTKEDISEKVSQGLFDSSIEYIKTLINQQSRKPVEVQQVKSAIGDKELQKIVELNGKVGTLDEQMKDMLNKLNQIDLDQLQKQTLEIIQKNKETERITNIENKIQNVMLFSDDLNELIIKKREDVKNAINETNNNEQKKDLGKLDINLQRLSSKADIDGAGLGDLLKGVKNIDKINDVQINTGKIKKNLQNVKQQVDDINTKQINPSVILNITQRVSYFIQIDRLEIYIGDLKRQVEDVKNKKNEPQVVEQDDQQDNELIEQIQQQIQDNEKKFRQLVGEMKRRFTTVDEKLVNKIDKEELSNINDENKNQLNIQWDKSVNKFSEQEEVKKLFKYLEIQIKKIIEKQSQERSPSPQKEDAFLSKKPYEGWSCGSCDKSLLNMAGLPADYTNWQKLPLKRDPNERIANVGQGFSRMLAGIKPGDTARYSKKFGQSQRELQTSGLLSPERVEDDYLPNIRNGK